jgi:hypothetical protein
VDLDAALARLAARYTILATRVVNLRTSEYDVYIGRAGQGLDGYFGNPYRVEVDGDRKQVLALFSEYFLWRVAHDAVFRRRVLGLRGKRLGCFCKPESCHGDVIVEWILAQPVAA